MPPWKATTAVEAEVEATAGTAGKACSGSGEGGAEDREETERRKK